MNNLHVQNMNDSALALAGSWEDQRSAQEIVMAIRKHRSSIFSVAEQQSFLGEQEERCRPLVVTALQK